MINKNQTDPTQRGAPDSWIPKEECRDRRLYRIHSRNLRFGVFRAETGGFLGLREKFGSVSVFEEYHHSNGPPYGTVFPLEELAEELPPAIELADSFPGSVCSKCGKDSEYAMWPEGGEREITLKDGSWMKVPGRWQHLDGTCCEDMHAYTKYNKALDAWLHKMEDKYKSFPKEK